jgi:hypothetical protein
MVTNYSRIQCKHEIFIDLTIEKLVDWIYLSDVAVLIAVDEVKILMETRLFPSPHW